MLVTEQQLRSRIAELEIQCSRLSLAAQGKFSESSYVVGLDPTDDGSLGFTMRTPIFHLFAKTLLDLFDRSGAINFVEQTVNHDRLGRIIITVQKCEGESPGQAVTRLQKRCDELEKRAAV